MTASNEESIGGAERSHMLQSLSVRLAELNDPGDVAATVLGEGLRFLGAGSGSICVLDPDGDELEIVAASGYAGDVIGAWSRFPVEADLPASVAVRTGRAVFLGSSAERDQRFPVFRSTPVIDEEAVACVPLRTADGEVVGSLVLGFAAPRSFSPEDERFLDDLCVHAATALVRTTGRIQLAFIADASARLAASLDLGDTFDVIGQLVVPRLADAAVVYLVIDGAVEAVPVGGEDGPIAELIMCFPVDAEASSGVGATLRTGQSSFTPDASDDVTLGAALVVPLRARSRVIGALASANTHGRSMSRTDRLLIEELAARAAVAIDNAELFADQQRARQAAETAEHRMRDLLGLMVTLSPAMGVDAVTKALRVTTFPGFEVRSQGLWTLNRDRTHLELAPAFDDGRVPSELVRLPVDAPLPAADALRTGEPVVVSSRRERDERYPSLARFGGLADGFVALPLKVDRETIGVFALGVAGTLTEADVPFLVAVAEQCTQALERGRLYDLERAARETAVADRRRIQELVSALQRSLLPPQLPEIPGAQLAACYLPGMAGLDVGGDFYDVFDTGGDWAMVIGDVCGKGPEAAALTAVARSTIRSIAMDLRHPSQVLRKLNEALRHQELDERFCTIAYTRVVPSAHGMRVAVCRGGHTAPLVRRADGSVEPVGAVGPLIGVFDDIRVWEETAMLEPGDALLLYTDGVTEARRDGDQLGEERLCESLAACDASSADSIAAAVQAAVLDFCGEPTDDTAILVLRVND